jgi:hypothetical protein
VALQAPSNAQGNQPARQAAADYVQGSEGVALGVTDDADIQVEGGEVSQLLEGGWKLLQEDCIGGVEIIATREVSQMQLPQFTAP